MIPSGSHVTICTALGNLNGDQIYTTELLDHFDQRDMRAVSTKALFLTYTSNRRLTYIRKIGLVDTDFSLTGQRTRLGPSRPTDG